MASINKEVAIEMLPSLRIYKDGTAERLADYPYAPPTPDGDPTTGVLSKDVSVSPDFSVRIYLPPTTTTPTDGKKIPILVYYHGGGFCFESAFSFLHHPYVNNIVSQANVICVSVEYRLAPEHLLPAAYDDCWAATQWVASHSVPNTSIKKDPWLTNYADFSKLFIGGDSAGANIVHYIALRAGREELNGNLKISGGFMVHPFFWGSKPMGSEPSKTRNREKCLPTMLWKVSHPSAPGGLDNPMINPVGAKDPACLAELACSTLLVSVAEKDPLRDRGVEYYHAVKQSGWKGEIELFEDMGVGHYFHMMYPASEKAKGMVKRVASFIAKEVGDNGSTNPLSKI